jgi:hypothetical protein
MMATRVCLEGLMGTHVMGLRVVVEEARRASRVEEEGVQGPEVCMGKVTQMFRPRPQSHHPILLFLLTTRMHHRDGARKRATLIGSRVKSGVSMKKSATMIFSCFVSSLKTRGCVWRRGVY